MAGGRPTKLDREAANAIVGILQLGLTIEDACAAAGISERAFHMWIKRGERCERARQPRPEDEPFMQFMQAVKKARALGKVAHIKTIQAASIGDGKTPGDWKASAWVLERMYPKEFGRRYIKIEGPSVGDGTPGPDTTAPGPIVEITIEGNPEVPLP